MLSVVQCYLPFEYREGLRGREISLSSSDGLGSSSRPQNFSYFCVAHPTCSFWIF